MSKEFAKGEVSGLRKALALIRDLDDRGVGYETTLAYSLGYGQGTCAAFFRLRDFLRMTEKVMGETPCMVTEIPVPEMPTDAPTNL